MRCLSFIVFSLSLLGVLSSCTIGFQNSLNGEGNKNIYVYLHSVRDTSSWTGQAERLSFHIRNEILKKRKLILTSEKDAQYVLDVNILERIHKIETEDDCRNKEDDATGLIAGNSLNCRYVNSRNKLPLVSPVSEALGLKVFVNIYNREKQGKSIFSKVYQPSNIPMVKFNSTGDVGDGFTVAGMANTPDLHPLRNLEAKDNAVSDYSKLLADEIVAELLKLKAK